MQFEKLEGKLVEDKKWTDFFLSQENVCFSQIISLPYWSASLPFSLTVGYSTKDQKLWSQTCEASISLLYSFF